MTTNPTRTWVAQIYKDFDSICYQYGVQLNRPFVVISDTEALLGKCEHLTRTISISQHVILNYPWHVTLNVFKHELAHLIAYELLGTCDAHGPEFKNACKMLGVPKEFSGAHINLDALTHDWKTAVSDEENAVLRKVDKLLNLAQSNNENESYLAMERVQHLLAKYNIEKLESAPQDDFVVCVLNFSKNRITQLQKMICSILTGHYFVTVIINPSFDPVRLKSIQTLEILGRRTNVLMAEFVYYHLVERCNSLWQQYAKENTLRGRDKTSYQLGLMSGFRNKLNQSRTDLLKREPTTEKALAIIENDPTLKNFVRARFPKIVRRSSAGSRTNADIFQDGQREGKKLVVKKPIESSSSNERRFLTRGL